jgi:hypothetical protein
MTISIKVDLVIVVAKAPLYALADVTLRCIESEITIRRCAAFEKPCSGSFLQLRRRRHRPCSE